MIARGMLPEWDTEKCSHGAFSKYGLPHSPFAMQSICGSGMASSAAYRRARRISRSVRLSSAPVSSIIYICALSASILLYLNLYTKPSYG